MCSSPAAPPLLIAGTPVVIPFQYQDGWFYSLGAEYQWNPQLALRAGIGFEKSPVTDTVRGPAIPDDDRTWLSVGGTYKYSDKLKFDLAYSHIFVKNAPINITNASNPFFAIGGGTTYTGSVDSHIDIISVAMHYRWDDPAPAPERKDVHQIESPHRDAAKAGGDAGLCRFAGSTCSGACGSRHPCRRNP